MADMPRLMALIGSGETADPMTRVHRMLARRVSGEPGSSAARAAIVDTPYRFQENAADLSASLVAFFTQRVGLDAAVTTFGREDDIVSRTTTFALLRDAPFVFAGPGSPSYAVRSWTGTDFPAVLADKLASGGALVFASAAALAMGRLTIPVYEMYKGGADPFWLPGIDVLGTVGISAAVVPHYDNREGQGHDTRFCFLGERRLRALEDQMPPGTYVLGVDEHTALVLDLDAERASVHGRGTVTLRERGAETVFRAGQEFELDQLRRSGAAIGAVAHAGRAPAAADLGQVDLVRRVMELERLASDQARTAALVGPLVETLLEMRRTARGAGDYDSADFIRTRLTTLGIELSDSADGRTSYRVRRSVTGLPDVAGAPVAADGGSAIEPR